MSVGIERLAAYVLVRTEEVGGEPPAGFTGEFVFRGVRHARRECERTVALAA